MRVIFKMHKDDSVRYVSHLDMLRAMQRVFLRSGLPVAFSQGFHPHQLITFGMPLPVGATSDSEYMDVTFREGSTAEEIAEGFAAALPPGWSLEGAVETGDKAPSLMAAADRGDWVLYFPDLPFEKAEARAKEILAAETVSVEKVSPKSRGKSVDIRPGIYGIRVEPDGDGSRVYADLAAGSRLNVSPGLLSLAMDPGVDLRILHFHRAEVYGEAGKKPVSLLDFYATLKDVPAI